MLEKQLPYKVKVYEELKQSILRGELVAGEVLNERRLSEEMGISRTPIREALQMLAQDGWISMEPHKGATIRRFDMKYLKDLSRLRSVLEVCAAEDAVRNVTDNDIRRMGKLIEAQKAKLLKFDPKLFIAADREFHSYIYALSRNVVLLQLLKNYYDLFLFMGLQAVTRDEERRNSTMQEHEAIYRAFQDRDVAAVSEAMRYHMEKTEENMVAKLSQN